MCLRRAGNLWEMSVKVEWKAVLACQTKVEKDCQVEIPGKKNRGKILSEGFSRKVNFQPELQVENSVAGEAGDWEKSQSGSGWWKTYMESQTIKERQM